MKKTNKNKFGEKINEIERFQRNLDILSKLQSNFTKTEFRFYSKISLTNLDTSKVFTYSEIAKQFRYIQIAPQFAYRLIILGLIFALRRSVGAAVNINDCATLSNAIRNVSLKHNYLLSKCRCMIQKSHHSIQINLKQQLKII